jgi:hypothetical protein
LYRLCFARKLGTPRTESQSEPCYGAKIGVQGVAGDQNVPNNSFTFSTKVSVRLRLRKVPLAAASICRLSRRSLAKEDPFVVCFALFAPFRGYSLRLPRLGFPG